MPDYRFPVDANNEFFVVNSDGWGDIIGEAREMEAQFLKNTRAGGFVQQTNQRSLEWIQKRARTNLRASMSRNKRPDQFRSGTLEHAIMDPKYSEATPEEVSFLIRSRIFDDVPYYASIEFGDYSQVGRLRVPFFFRSSRLAPDSINVRGTRRSSFRYEQSPLRSRSNRYGNRKLGLRPSIPRQGPRRTTDRIIGKREADALGLDLNTAKYVKIKRPVPRYAYGTKAGDLFLRKDLYTDFLDLESKTFQEKYGVPLGGTAEN